MSVEDNRIKNMQSGKYNICLFAGTSEGRRLADFLGGQNINVTVSTATEYGAALLKSYENEIIKCARLSAEDMADMFQHEKYDLVIDATHPYADAATRNISEACLKCGIKYLRLNRGSSDIPDDAVMFSDAAEAAAFLDGTSGNILLAVGSKELIIYKNITDFAARSFARVLPLASSLESCSDAGVLPAHIFAMQGPFSEEMNVEMLKLSKAAWMVTKDGADEGGFRAKANACKMYGARLVVIGRPEEVRGKDYSTVIRMLCDEYGCICRPEIKIAGTGPGSHRFMTEEARKYISEADCLIGAGRMLDSFRDLGKPVFEAVDPLKIFKYIESEPQYRKYVILMSGDTGFFSGAKRLQDYLRKWNPQVIPGVSTLSYLCSRTGISYDDAYVMSLHGREGNIASVVRRNKKTFILTDGRNNAAYICERLNRFGLGNVRTTIGQRLSYPDEKIFSGTAIELADGEYDPLCGVLIENDITTGWNNNTEASGLAKDETIISTSGPGMADELFIRNVSEGKTVPMTKKEVRAICMSIMCVAEDSICWDVGAGTGSVSVEMAAQAYKGMVYAIEKRDEAVDLINKNAIRFHLDNIKTVSGSAPQVLEELPAPTHVFVGGSSGNIKEIIRTVIRKNPHAVIAATAVSLEAISELTTCVNDMKFEFHVTAVNVSRDRKAGEYHIMSAQNPIYIFCIRACKAADSFCEALF